MSGRRFAVVAGGGTAGHAVPALAVARALVENGHDRADIELIASRRGPEGAVLQGEGFGLTLLPGRGLVRRARPKDLVQNVQTVGLLLVAMWRAFTAFARWRPRVAVSVGGYASFPAGVAAVVRRVPLVVLNIDAVPGLTNRLLGRFAAACAVGFDGTPLPRAVTTGTPVRAAISAVDRTPEGRAKARQALGLPEGIPLVAVFGGSLGARRVNLAAVDLAGRWAGRGDRVIYHATGTRDFEEMTARATGRSDDSRLVAYEDRMDLLYAAADLMVCRAGAMTVAELAVTGVPAVLVPLPTAPGDHQTANARALVDAQAAVLLPDPECDADHLAPLVDRLLDDPAALERMGEAARSLGHIDAAARVAAVVEARAR